MISPPFISIITVVYNAADTLEQTILSVLNQSYTDKEYIIIDGGSTDGSLEIIRKYETRLAFWISETDSGIFDAMNKGIVRAKGDLIGIINADDWYEPDIFQSIAARYQQEGPQLVIHGMMRNFQNGIFYSVTGNSVHRLRYDMIQHPTCFVSRDLYQQVGNFDLKYRHSSDYDLILKFYRAGVKFSFLEKIIANFRLGGNSALPVAEREMYRVRMKNKMISRAEGWIRIALAVVSLQVKRFLK